jgi:hypothetical protein
VVNHTLQVKDGLAGSVGVLDGGLQGNTAAATTNTAETKREAGAAAATSWTCVASLL